MHAHVQVDGAVHKERVDRVAAPRWRRVGEVDGVRLMAARGEPALELARGTVVAGAHAGRHDEDLQCRYRPVRWLPRSPRSVPPPRTRWPRSCNTAPPRA